MHISESWVAVYGFGKETLNVAASDLMQPVAPPPSPKDNRSNRSQPRCKQPLVMFLAHFREALKRNEEAPLTSHHARPLLEVEPTVAALALLAVLAHDAALHAILAPTRRLVGEEAGRTVRIAGPLVGQEVT